jgi:hypothetical protein
LAVAISIELNALHEIASSRAVGDFDAIIQAKLQ